MVTQTKNLNHLTKPQREELAELVYVLQKRKQINPLSFLKLLPIQQKFNDAKSWLELLFGGNRSGKTTPAAKKVLDFALSGRRKIWVCGETYQDSIAIQQKKIWELCPKDQITYGSYDDINGFSNRKLKLKSGTMITFKSYDQKREAFQSDDIDMIWNDEEPPIEIVKEQRMRLIDRNGTMIISMTSLKGVTDLIEDIFVDYDVIESQMSPIVNVDLPRVAEKNGVKIFFLWTNENPHISQDRLKEEIKLMTRDEILARIHGMPINLSGKIYPSFNKKIHVISIDDMPESQYTLYHILDPHDRKPFAMCWIAVHPTGVGYLIDEYPNKNFNEMLSDDKTYDDYAMIVHQKEAQLKSIFKFNVTRRIIDPNFGNKTVKLAQRQGGQSHTTPKAELKKRGLHFHDGIDPLEQGHLAVRQLLHYQLTDNEVTYQPKLFFCDYCTNSITHHSRYSRKDINAADGDVKDNARPMDKYKDYCDLVRYYAMDNPRFIHVQRPVLTAPRAY